MGPEQIYLYRFSYGNQKNKIGEKGHEKSGSKILRWKLRKKNWKRKTEMVELWRLECEKSKNCKYS